MKSGRGTGVAKTIVGKRLVGEKSVKVKEWRTNPSLELTSVAAHNK